LAFLSSFSASPVPRIACRGPCASATPFFAAAVIFDAASDATSGPGTDVASALPPSSLIRRSRPFACADVSLRCSRNRFLYASRDVIEMCAFSAVSSSFSLP
jgi:hypothetical protein